MNGDAAYGLFAQCVIVATAIRFVRELRGHARVNRFGLELWIPSVAMLVVSIEGVSLAGHLRGLWGDPSIVTFVLLMLYTVRPSLLPDRPLGVTTVCATIFVAFPLYAPLVLEVPGIQTDLYSLGWDPTWILIAVAIIVVASTCLRTLGHRWINIVAIALGAYCFGVMESDNLWDYLVDPGLLAVLAFLAVTSTIGLLRGRIIPTNSGVDPIKETPT